MHSDTTFERNNFMKIGYHSPLGIREDEIDTSYNSGISFKNFLNVASNITNVDKKDLLASMNDIGLRVALDEEYEEDIDSVGPFAYQQIFNIVPDNFPIILRFFRERSELMLKMYDPKNKEDLDDDDIEKIYNTIYANYGETQEERNILVAVILQKALEQMKFEDKDNRDDSYINILLDAYPPLKQLVFQINHTKNIKLTEVGPVIRIADVQKFTKKYQSTRNPLRSFSFYDDEWHKNVTVKYTDLDFYTIIALNVLTLLEMIPEVIFKGEYYPELLKFNTYVSNLFLYYETDKIPVNNTKTKDRPLKLKNNVFLSELFNDINEVNDMITEYLHILFTLNGRTLSSLYNQVLDKNMINNNIAALESIEEGEDFKEIVAKHRTDLFKLGLLVQAMMNLKISEKQVFTIQKKFDNVDEVLQDIEEYETKIDEKDQIIAQQEEKIQDLNKSIAQLDSLQLKNQLLNDKIASLEEFIESQNYANKIEDNLNQQNVEDYNQDEFLKELNTKRITIVGGYDAYRQKLLDIFPNAKTYSADVVDSSYSLKDTDILILNTFYLNHPVFYKIKNLLKKTTNQVDVIYINENNTNPKRFLDNIHKQLKQ